MKNSGGTPLDVLTARYEVHGFQLGGSRRQVTADGETHLLSKANWAEVVQQYSLHGASTCFEVVQYGQLAETMTHLGPGETRSSRVLVAVPSKDGVPSYDALRVLVSVAGTRDDDLMTGEAKAQLETVEANGSRSVFSVWPIWRSTLLARLISAQREAHVGYSVDTKNEDRPTTCEEARVKYSMPVNPTPYLEFAYSITEEVSEEHRESLRRHYDPFWVFGVWEYSMFESRETEGEESSSGTQIAPTAPG
jgi:hypothetical protein